MDASICDGWELAIRARAARTEWESKLVKLKRKDVPHSSWSFYAFEFIFYSLIINNLFSFFSLSRFSSLHPAFRLRWLSFAIEVDWRRVWAWKSFDLQKFFVFHHPHGGTWTLRASSHSQFTTFESSSTTRYIRHPRHCFAFVLELVSISYGRKLLSMAERTGFEASAPFQWTDKQIEKGNDGKRKF